ncbi:alpha/beta fold hydrolase BchO [Oceanibaculum indicum]|uniref:Magnesium chelatase accessory protein n=1 Tax=Oceanibaculum indicum P24 TaxID=1207063 RepID=K2JL67_9PROT|nr:alpha/beta fold hydrolase BchO [Oceanibaculum indicum]EKE76073.1 magnesium chelatase accessory protein [Oceanibaculum indicum P24]
MSAASCRLDWETEGHSWPYRQHSQFVTSGRLTWHLQFHGPADAPLILLLHGTGASGHSWQRLVPLLAERYRLMIPDLPGHGFTTARGRTDLSLDGMAMALRALLDQLGLVPDTVIGHSAGGPIAIVLSGMLDPPPRRVIGINGAYLPIRGNRIFSPLAKALFANPLSAAAFALLTRATPLAGNLLASTGSRINRESSDIYRRLMRMPGHVQGALGMMAAWDLGTLDDRMRKLDMPLILIAARDDPMVPDNNSRHVAKLTPHARLILTGHGGHLLHESEPAQVCGWIEQAMAEPAPNPEAGP